jgi:ABC-type Fe3+-hydroxamate transport system substrate-binding protein
MVRQAGSVMVRPLPYCLLMMLGALALAVARPEPAALPRAGAVRSVLDTNGAGVSVDLPYRGSAFLAPTVAEYLFATGHADTILVGPTSWPLDDHLLARVFPAMLSTPALPRGGGRGGPVETLLRLQPGAVFAWYFQVPSLLRVGLPAVAVSRAGSVNPAPVEKVRPYTETLGLAGRAEAIDQSYRRAMAVTTDELKRLAPPVNPTVLAIGFFSGGRIIAWGKGNPYLALLARAGAASATEAANPAVLDTEHILALDPAVILLRPSGVAAGEVDPVAFMQEGRWAGLAAVAARRVYRLPEGGSVYFGGVVEDPLLVRWAAELLHPALRHRLRGMMRETYARELGVTVTDSALDTMLNLAANGPSSGYARFARDQEE